MAEVEKYAPWIALASVGGVLAWLFYELYLKPRPGVTPLPSPVEVPKVVEVPSTQAPAPAPVIVVAPPAAPAPAPTVTTVEEPEEKYFVHIVVSDQEGNPVEGADVTVDGLSRKTDPGGVASFELTRDKSYTATASKAGYSTVSQTFKVSVDNQEVHLTLRARTVQFADVEVTYE
jgi:hypothetical protein